MKASGTQRDADRDILISTGVTRPMCPLN